MRPLARVIVCIPPTTAYCCIHSFWQLDSTEQCIIMQAVVAVNRSTSEPAAAQSEGGTSLVVQATVALAAVADPSVVSVLNLTLSAGTLTCAHMHACNCNCSLLHCLHALYFVDACCTCCCHFSFQLEPDVLVLHFHVACLLKYSNASMHAQAVQHRGPN